MKIALFSTSVPDPTQGGSGIFNYYLSKYLLERGYAVKAFFRVNDSFLKHHTTLKYIPELTQKGLVYEMVQEDHRRWKKLKVGLPFLLQQHQYNVCQRTIDENLDQLKTYDGCISLDLGWAFALAKVPVPKICMINDPIWEIFKYGAKSSLLTPGGWLHLMRRLSFVSVPQWLRSLLQDFDGKYAILGSFSPQHVKEYQRLGLPIRHFRWFTPPPSSLSERPSPPKNKIITLHVGSLYPNASQNFMKYSAEELMPLLAKLPFDIEFRFIGKFDPVRVMQSRWENIRLEYLGPRESIEEEFRKAHLFFSPMKYPVGVRTRIITALSYGIPVIADISSSVGLPELIHGQDILYGSTPEETVQLFGRLYHEPEFALAVGKNARKAWEEYYNPAINIPDLVKPLSLL